MYMMPGVVITLLIAALTKQVQCVGDNHSIVATGCPGKHGVTMNEIHKFHLEPDQDQFNSNFKCFAACLMQYIGLMTFESNFVHTYNSKESIQQGIVVWRTCKEASLTTEPCDTGIELLKCIAKFKLEYEPYNNLFSDMGS